MDSAVEGPGREAERRIADVAQAHGTHLDLTGLLLTVVPDSIGQLTALASLSLSGNQLTVVPDSIGQLTALASLDLLLRVTEDADEGGAGDADVGVQQSPAAGVAGGLWW